MARRRVEASLPASLLGQTAAILIMLSVSGECLQCYWCGPLAEQVHRSQRAPPCDDAAANVTACDPGYTHCAVVASSPPFVESRYCVKFYQDECYTLYCGTTKTYRTTCPCRGELCNGPNTQREIDAFAALRSAVAKTHNNRISKRNAIASGIVNIDKYRTHNLINNDEDSHDESANEIDKDNVKNETSNAIVAPTEQPDSESENVNNHIADPNNTERTTSETHDNKATQSVLQETEQHESAAHNKEPATHEEQVEMTKPTETIPTVSSKDVQNVNEMEHMPEVPVEKHDDLTTTRNPTEAPIKPTQTMKVEESPMIRSEIKPSVQLPTAEALQQGESAITTEKPMEHTVTIAVATTQMTTVENDKHMTPKTTKATKNNAEITYLGILVLLTCLTINVTL